MSVFFSIVGGMQKDLSMSRKFLKAIINDFELTNYNRDLCVEGLKVAKRCRDVLDEICSKTNNPTTLLSTSKGSSAQLYNNFLKFIENSKELQNLGDCLWKLSTFSGCVVTTNVNTHEERERFVSLVNELDVRTSELQHIIVDWKSKRSKWSSVMKKKIKALGKFSSIIRRAMIKDSLKLKIPTEHVKTSYNYNCFQALDTSDVAEVNPVVRGSRNHIRLRWYGGTSRVAEKEVGNFSIYDEKYKEMIEEIKFMKDLSSCDHILALFGYCQHPSGFSIISRWEDYNLQTYLAENKELDWIEKLSISCGIANALDYCHKKDILHYDVKTENVLLDQHFEPKLCNFRVDKKSTVFLTSTSAPLDTLRYSSPERVKGEKYTKASEIYSFALVLWEIQHHELPYGGLTPKEISKEILKGKYPPQKPIQGTPVEFQNIIEEAWSQIPEARPNMEKLHSSLENLSSRYLLNEKVDLIDYNEEYFDESSDASTEDLGSSRITEKLLAKGIKYHQKRQYKKAWKVFEEYESKSTDIEGKYWVGYYYLKGWHENRKGVKGIPNPRAGVFYLRFAADSGHVNAQCYYASTILNHGVAAKEHYDKDRTRIAIDYLKNSAKQDHPDALRMLGWMISKGQYPRYGLSKDIIIGRAMIQKSRNIKRASFISV